MIKSMTGFGRHQEIINGRDILIEIKSVNNRYYDFSSRTPRIYAYLEEKLKTFVKGTITRGKIDVNVIIHNVEGEEEHIDVNRIVAKEYIAALRSANEELGLEDDLTLSRIMRLPDIFNVRKAAADEDVIWSDVKTVAEKALEKFVYMREIEGEKMRDDILSRLNSISEYVKTIEFKSPENVVKYREKLFAKLSEVLSNNNIDEHRIITEAAIFSERTAVDEETVRLKSHIEQFTTLIDSSEPIGRKLDFLIQEFNREANTIGSKSTSLDITNIVVEIKSEIEKIREQIQNIE